MKKQAKEVVRIHAQSASDHWLVRFPDRTVVARDKTMVQHLVEHYGKEHNVLARVHWDGAFETYLKTP